MNDAEILLGARLSLDGGDETECTDRLDQGKALAGKVAFSLFSTYDAETICREIWVLSIGYYLPMTQFTDT